MATETQKRESRPADSEHEDDDKDLERRKEPKAIAQLKAEAAALPVDQQIAWLQPPRPVPHMSGAVTPASGSGLESLQKREEGPGNYALRVHETAAQGIEGGGSRLPHLDRIQASFGGHDVSNVGAHVGGKAAQASAAIGAQAYASGNDVAFKSTPDLHTAAHEAAHVVQQRAGVSLQDGVGKAGDSYEKQADAVADRVVSGGSAAELLGGSATAGSSGTQRKEIDGPAKQGDTDVVQRLLVQYRADRAAAASTAVDQDFFRMGCERLGLDYNERLAWIQSRPEYRDMTFVSVEAAVAALHGLATRDGYFNSRLKVAWENDLGQALNSERSKYEGVLNEVLQWCKGYLETKRGTDANDLKVEWRRMTSMFGGDDHKAKPWEIDLFYGRIANSIDEVNDTFYKNMYDLFSGAGGFSVSQKCQGIQDFHNKVYEKDWKADQQHGTYKVQDLMESLRVKATDPNLVRWGVDSNAGGTTASDTFGQEEEGVGGGERRGRTHVDRGSHGSERTVRRGVGGRDVAGPTDTPDTNRTNRHTGPQATGDQRQIHGRGIDKWTMDERQPFIQQARMLDMPLAGSVSGTTSDLITIARFAGIPDGSKKAFLFMCGALDHFIGAGAHTFHEVMTAAQPFGINYTAGDYYSFFEEYRSELPAVQRMFTNATRANSPYKNVKGIDKSM